LICASSAFFKAALGHDWKEAGQRSVQLEDDEPKIFQVYLNWLYCREFPYDDEEKSTLVYGRLLKGYVLADKLQDGDFADAVLDEIIKTSQRVWALDGRPHLPGASFINYLYSNTLHSSRGDV
jgi:hypothetical protein